MLAAVATVRQTQPRLGTRKLQHTLAAAGVPVGRDRLFACLRATGQLVPRKRRATQTTYARHRYAVAPNLVTGHPPTAPRQVLVSDITYLRLADGGFAYLFLITDLVARCIVGWHLSRDLSHHAALRALEAACTQLGDTTGVIHHSDRGTQYCCHAYQRALTAARMLPSMTDAAHCYQNAVAERVNGILKDEFDLDAVFPAFAVAHHAVTTAIHTYNTLRPHGSLAMQTPLTVLAQAA